MMPTIGAKIVFRYTGGTGVVTALLGDGMVRVKPDDDPEFEMPVAVEDIQLYADWIKKPAPLNLPDAGKKADAPPPLRTIRASGPIAQPMGLLAAFEPMKGRDETVSRYNAWLINDTEYEFLFDYSLVILEEEALFREDKLPARTALEIGDLFADELNDWPEVTLIIRRLTTGGPDEERQKTIKLKPKNFVNAFGHTPVINLHTHRLTLFSPDEITAAPLKDSDQEDLKTYAQKAKKSPKSQQQYSTPFELFNVEAFAHFEPEIDLHIEQLMGGHVSRLDPGEILRIQMQHFERFMNRAILLGVHRVFIIHGVGEGKLRAAIAERLREMPDVHKFANQFHHKYGYGATEVWL